MTISVQCTSCGARLKASGAAIGTIKKCPRCGRPVHIVNEEDRPTHAAEPALPEPMKAPRLRRNRRSIYLMAGLGGAGALVVVVAAVIAFSVGKTKPTPAIPAQASVEGSPEKPTKSTLSNPGDPAVPKVEPTPEASKGPLPVTQGDLSESAQADLDRLLLLLRQEGVVLNNAKAVVQSAEKWIQDVDRLKNSAGPIVRNAVHRLKPAVAMHRQAIDAEIAAKQLIAELNKDTGPTGEEYVNAARRFANGLDEVELDELVRKGQISLDEKEEYLRLAGKANAAFMQKVTQAFGNALTVNVMTFQKTHRLRRRAEILQNDVIAQLLAPILQARAGKEQASPPLKISAGEFRGFGQGLYWTEFRLNFRSTAPEDLTRLTLLLEFQTNEGWRFATIYLPKLPASGGAQVPPIQLSWMYLNEPPADLVRFLKNPPQKLIESEIPSSLKVGLKITRARYSVWCDQFRAEGLEPAMLPKEEMVNDTRLLAVQPGSTFRSERGISNPQNDAAGRFELTFVKLSSSKVGYEVEAKLIDRQKDEANAAGEVLRGMLKLPPVKIDNIGQVVSEDQLLLKLSSGSQEMQLHLQGRWKDAEWRWHCSKGLAAGRRFVP